MALYAPVQEEQTVDYTPDYVAERGTTMDILHDLWAGTGSALDLIGAGTGLDSVRKAGEWIQDTEFARPDTSQYYGTQGRLGRVVDGVFESAPLTLGLMGTGALTGGLGVAGGLGVIGRGVFVQSMEEIEKERPELSADEKFRYSLINGALEAGSEAMTMLPFGVVGKLFKGASKGAKSSLVSTLADSGRVSANDVISSLVKGVGAKKATAALFGSATADGASEVINELGQAANRESVGLEENPVDLIDIFLIGSAPGGVVAGGALASQASSKAKVRQRMETLLTSENLTERQNGVALLSEGIGNIHPELKDLVSRDLFAAAEAGPINLDEPLPTDPVTDVIENSGQILREGGIDPETGETALPLGAVAEGPREPKTSELPPGAVQVSAADIQKPGATGFEKIRETLNVDQELDGLPRAREVFEPTTNLGGTLVVEEQKALDMQRERLVKLGLDPEVWMNSMDTNTQESVQEAVVELDELKTKLATEKMTLKERKKVKKEIKENEQLLEEEFAEATPEATEAPSETAEVEQVSEVKAEPAAPKEAPVVSGATGAKLIEYADGTKIQQDQGAKADRRWKVYKNGKEYHYGTKAKAEEAVSRDMKGEKDVTQKTRKTIDTKEMELSKDQKQLRDNFFKDAEAMAAVAKDQKHGKDFNAYLVTAVNRLAEGNKLLDLETGTWDIAEVKAEVTRAYDRYRNTEEGKRASRQGMSSGSGVSTDVPEQTGKATFRQSEVADEIANVGPESAPEPTETVAVVTKRQSVEVNKLMEGIIKGAKDKTPQELEPILERIESLDQLTREEKDYVYETIGGLETEAPAKISKEERVAQRKEKPKEAKKVEVSKEEEAEIIARKKVADARELEIAKLMEEQEMDATETEETTEAREDLKERYRQVDMDAITEQAARDDVESGLAEDLAIWAEPDVLEFAKNNDMTDEFWDEVLDTWAPDGNLVTGLQDFKKQFPGTPPTTNLYNQEMILRVEIANSFDIVKADFETAFPNPVAILENIIENGTKEEVALAKMIMDSKSAQAKMKDMEVEVVLRGSFFRGGKEPKVAIASGQVGNLGIQLHEIHHSCTSDELRNNPAFREAVQVMMRNYKNYVSQNGLLEQKQFNAIKAAKGSSKKFHEIMKDYGPWTDDQQQIAYALINEAEFTAQPMNSPVVRDIMNVARHTNKQVKGQKVESIWQRLKGWFKDIFKFPTEYESVLEAVLKTNRELYDARTGVRHDVDADLSLTKEEREMSHDEIVRQVLADKRKTTRADKSKSLFGAKGRQAFKWAKDMAEPIADTLRRISDPIYAKLMVMEGKLNAKQEEYSRQAKPFLKWYEGLTESQQADIDVGLMNGKKEVWSKIPKDARKSLETLLRDLGQRAMDVGLLTEMKDGYFPRRVGDSAALFDELMKDKDTKGPLGVKMQELADRMGVEVASLTQADRNQVVTQMLQSGEVRQLPRPGGTKERKIHKVTPRVYPFYQNSRDALMGHIYEMNEKVSMREFVGGSARKQKVTELMSLSRKIEKEKDPKKKSLMLDQWDAKANVLSNLEEDLSGGIQELIDTELSDAPADVQTEVFEILDARMRQKGAHGIVDTVRNVNYIFSMGNFLSAITQLGDIPIVFYRYGVNGDTLKSVGEAFKNVANVARGKEGTALVEAMDFTNALREFSSGDKISAKALETVFKYSGLKYVDLIGKEASMRASLKYYQNPKNKAEFLSKYENFFEDAGAVYSKLQLGNTADMDVKTVLISELAEYQPVTMSQQSKAYLKGGNLRAFYALKTFTLRTTSAAIREGLVDINKGGAKNIAKGTTRMAGILFIYALAGAGADELKDLARGKTSSITDNTVDNMLQMLFISKYSLEKGMQEGAPIKSFMSNLLPPIRYADNFLTDVYSLASDEKDFKYKSLQTVPFIGSIAFGQSPVGQEQDLKNQRDDILKKVRENAKSRKGARDGLTDDIRKYNRSVSGDQRIGNDAVQRAFKEGR